MAFRRVNGIVIHYREEGARNRPAIVFSNSLGTDFRIWDQVVLRLRDDYRILRYDKRGHGLSEATPAPYEMATHVADLEAFMAALSIDDALVVGLSVGGMIAQGLAHAHPQRTRALVLCDTGHKIGTEELWKDRIAAIEKDGIGAISDQILARWFTQAYRAPENADFVGYSNMLLRTPLEGYLGTSAALRDTDYTQQTATLTLPTLCIVGEADGSTPPDLVRSLADLIAGSEYHVVKNAGHLPCIEQPEETARLIGDFAARQLSGAAGR